MRRLILMRHAKSDWSQPGRQDKDRCLNTRGRMAAPRMGRWLKSQDFQIDSIRSSSSERTRETWALMAEALLGDEPESSLIRFYDDLYLATASKIWDHVRDHFNHAQSPSTLMLLAHNPGMELLVRALANQDSEFPTAAVAIFENDDAKPVMDLVNAIENGEWKLIKLKFPRELVD